MYNYIFEYHEPTLYALGSLGFFDTLFPVTIYGSTRTTENTCARTVYLGRKLLNEWPIYVWIEKYHKKINEWAKFKYTCMTYHYINVTKKMTTMECLVINVWFPSVGIFDRMENCSDVCEQFAEYK